MATSTVDDATKDDDSSQWTRVVRKGKKLGPKQQRPRPPHHPPAAGPAENFQPNPSPQLSPDDIHATHDHIASKWRASEAHGKLCSLVEANATSHVVITRAVCLGLGTFDPDDGSWVAQRRSHVQLAAFLTMVVALEADTGLNIECFYQEPRLAQPDKDFILSLGGKVVESPASYGLIGPETLVFGVHLYRDVWAAALERSLPGLFVGTGWDVWDENQGADRSPDFERIREMDATFDKFAFPQDGHASFSSTCVYWKKRDVDAWFDLNIDGLRISPGEDPSRDDNPDENAAESRP